MIGRVDELAVLVARAIHDVDESIHDRDVPHDGIVRVG